MRNETKPEENLLPSQSGAAKVRNIARVCVLVAITALIFAAAHRLRRPATQSLNPFKSIGHQAPDFVLSTADGKAIHLSDYRGKTVLLNFFGDTCAPCREETPWLVDIQREEAAKGVQIIGIEMYGASDDGIKKFAQEFRTNYILVHGNESVGGEYAVGEFPTSYFLSGEGSIVAATVGLHRKNETESKIEAALGASGLSSTIQQHNLP